MRLRPTENAFIFGVFRAPGTCLVAANVCPFLLNEIETLKQMITVASACSLLCVTVCGRFINFYVIIRIF